MVNLGPGIVVRALALAVLLSACRPAVPGAPSYEADVRPIFMSTCVRCHGAGGTLNGDRGPDGGFVGLGPPSPPGPYLDHYEDRDCALDDAGARPADCKLGALSTSALDQELIHLSDPMVLMPPAPAPALDDWQMAVVDLWVKTPICSRDPNPDPSICPPGVGP
jgi:hypothetical protein